MPKKTLFMTPLQTLLNEFRELATSNRDLGDKFERLFLSMSVLRQTTIKD
jgi:hypothetical protein